MGIWFFSFKNWVISREMPRVLLENGGAKVSYCIPLDKISERGYDKIKYFVAGLGICIFFGKFAMYVILGWVVNKDLHEKVKLDTINRGILISWYISCILTTIPWLLPCLFHLKSVFTIYKSTRQTQSNFWVMVAHCICIFLFFGYMLLYCAEISLIIRAVFDETATHYEKLYESYIYLSLSGGMVSWI